MDELKSSEAIGNTSKLPMINGRIRISSDALKNIIFVLSLLSTENKDMHDHEKE